MTLHYHGDHTELVLIDSGAGGCFIDHDVVKEHSMTPTQLEKPIKVKNVDGTENKKGQITHFVRLNLTINDRHCNIRFLITGIGKNRLILGLPWLIRENPDIDWKTGTLRWRTLSELQIAQIETDEEDDSDFENDEDESTLETAQYCINSIHLHPDIIISRAKISELIEQQYGDNSKKGLTERQLVPKEYHAYLDRFSKKEANRYPDPRIWDHEINLKPDFKPKRIPPYSLNSKETKLARDFVNDNLKKGYIVKSKSPMASPLFFVGKKDGNARPCQDYRQLNEGTIKDAFPLPNIQDLLRDLQGAKLFTKLDIRWGYNNIQIKPEHRWKAAFSTPFGLYEPTVMFFGLCNSPATFQRMMNHILQDQIGEGWCKVYMDDILIYGQTREEVKKRTLQVLEVGRKEDLFFKPEKCDFEKTKIEYLGYVIKPDTIAMDPKKLSGIADWPIPKTLRQVRSFLGFGNFYRRFIAGYSRLVKPMTELTKKDQNFEWTPKTQEAFDQLKKRFLSAPVLRMPDPEQPFFLETDASAFATGAVLMQKDENGKLHPNGYLSKTFNSTEQNYPIYDRELFALVRALKEWRVLLEGAPHTITVYTDHENLKYFRSAQKLNRRQFRWSMYLSNFPLKLEHRPGKTMVLSDALSRRADQEEQKTENNHMTLLPRNLFVNLLNMEINSVLFGTETERYEPETAARLKNLLEGKDEKNWELVNERPESNSFVLLYKGKICVPNDDHQRRKILQEYHDSPRAGHPGAQTTYWLVSKDYWWPGLSNYVRNYVKGCSACQQMKIDRRPWKGPLQTIPGSVDQRPFSLLSMDLLTDLPVSEQGFDTILVVLDHGTTKGIVLIPTRKRINSMDTAELLRDNVFKRFGLAKSIISDRDPRFASTAFQGLMELLGIKSKLSTAYHPQTDGATERAMQEIEAYLSIYCLSNPSDWPAAIATLEFAYNSKPHADRKRSPFELLMGYQPRGTPEQFKETKFPDLEKRIQLMDRWRKDAEAAHEIARRRMEERSGRPLETFRKGQKVWLDSRNLRTRYNKKIAPRREGPFKISEVLGPVTYRLKLPKTWKTHDSFHSILLKPFTQTPQYGPAKTPPIPELIDGEKEYEVDHIVRHKRNKRGHLQFLIRWKNYGAEDDSWEPASNLKHAKETLKEYKRRHDLA